MEDAAFECVDIFEVNEDWYVTKNEKFWQIVDFRSDHCGQPKGSA